MFIHEFKRGCYSNKFGIKEIICDTVGTLFKQQTACISLPRVTVIQLRLTQCSTSTLYRELHPIALAEITCAYST